MKRSAIVSLGCATVSKWLQVRQLMGEYRKAVQFYIDLCWDQGGKFDAVTLRKIDSPLSYRYKGQALKQAMGIVVGTKKAAKERGKQARKPIFRGGMDLSINQLQLSLNGNSFDLWAKLSTLTKGKPIWLPARRTRVFNKWCGKGVMIPGGTVFDRDGRFYLRVSFTITEPGTSDGPVLGIDRGVNNVLATSERELIGTELDKHIDRIKRTVPKSKGRIRARKARDQYVHECLKRLPFSRFAVFAIEMLKGIKHGKRGKLSRRTNRRFSHWTVGRMGVRLQQLCEEHAVQLCEVPPAYTSQTCPECSHRERANRCGAVFRCVLCGYQDHADLVGARNIRDRWLGTFISVPHAKICKV
jgi:putative transposase